jgi:hypothetical protein
MRASAFFAVLALSFPIAPAHAELQLSISADGSTFTCADGELACDLSGAAHNLLTVDTTVGGAFVQLTLTISTFGKLNTLSLSSADIINETGAPIDIKLLASDTGFVAPASFINESASLTFADAVGSGASTLKFWADPADAQGANPTNTPGALLFTATGVPLINPDSFEGTHTSPFAAIAPFSMTEGGSLNLIAGGSVTGFNEEMQTGVPEPSTWAMILIGGAMLAFGQVSRKRGRRFLLGAMEGDRA